VPTRHLSDRVRPLNTADDTSIVQRLYCWVREEEQERLCHDTHRLPVRRFFEPEWEYHLPCNAGRLERLSAHATEVISRLTLPNDFLFKTDTASMKEGLELRVPMLDEDLFAFGLSLPHELKVKGRLCKRVLRKLATLKLPRQVAQKPKWGFGIPVDTWVDDDFRPALRDTLLGCSSKLSEFFRPSVYRPMLEAFCDGRPCPGISRQGLYQRAIMLLAAHLALDRR
jgi:asparagine synthetase B (glutamine-hydrolysing)